MTRDQARQASSDAAFEHVRGKREQALRDHERRRISCLVGPGHNYDLAPDAPEGADPRLDNTGFCDGGVL
jgi:hypothetical protein